MKGKLHGAKRVNGKWEEGADGLLFGSTIGVGRGEMSAGRWLTKVERTTSPAGISQSVLFTRMTNRPERF